jgi:L-ascorbate metabolism protein UlaG (beta-lactamase superfamily)
MTTYRNLDGTTPDKRFTDILRWKIGDRLSGKGPADDRSFVPPVRSNDGSGLASREAHLTWIGHASFVLRQGGKLCAIDPIWSKRIATLARRAPPGVALENVPPIDVVTISHSHRDHLDIPTLERIGPSALYVVPKDMGAPLRDAGLTRVVELGWWESHVEGGLTITLVPAQHWSMRTPWDRNKSLWGGFVYESGEGTSYHSGDTAFNEGVFSAIARRFPRIDWAMLPIGAYDPSWFMQPQHVNPEEAGRIWEILGARFFCAMHWGTFKLTDESLAEPPERLRAFWKAHGHDPSRLWLFDIGETRALSSHDAAA